MKTILALLFTALLISAAPAQTGYLVIVTNPMNGKTEVTRTQSRDEVSDLFRQAALVNVQLDAIYPPESVYFEYRTMTTEFYCEKRRVTTTKTGKVRYVRMPLGKKKDYKPQFRHEVN